MVTKKKNDSAPAADAPAADEAAGEQSAPPADAKPSNGTAEKKKPVRKPIYVAVPVNVDDLAVEDPTVPEEPEVNDEGKSLPVEEVPFATAYHFYAVPGGPGMKKAINRILAKHNIDLRNIGRVRMFSGDKSFAIEPQYNIRF